MTLDARHSDIRAIRVVRGARKVAEEQASIPRGSTSPFVVLDPFLVSAELLLDLVDALVHRRFGGRSFFAGEKIVLVLGRDTDLHLPGVLDVVDGHLDRHQPAEILEQLLGLFAGGSSCCSGPKTAVAGRYLDLHPSAPCLDHPPDPDKVPGAQV